MCKVIEAADLARVDTDPAAKGPITYFGSSYPAQQPHALAPCRVRLKKKRVVPGYDVDIRRDAGV